MTRHPLAAAAAIAALFAVGITCAGEETYVAHTATSSPEATVDPDVPSSAPTSLTVDVLGPVAPGIDEEGEG